MTDYTPLILFATAAIAFYLAGYRAGKRRGLRQGVYLGAMEDARQAMLYIRQHMNEWMATEEIRQGMLGLFGEQ